MRYATLLSLGLAACGTKKLDRAAVDKIVTTADACAKDNDLMCVLQAEKHMSELAGKNRELDQADKDYLSSAGERVAADVEAVKNAKPGRQPSN